MEVYDGSSWIIMASSFPTVELTPEVQGILNWARTKMTEEHRIKELAAKHPTVANAIEAVQHAQEQLCVVTALVDTQ
jgi:hypothetical protein